MHSVENVMHPSRFDLTEAQMWVSKMVEELGWKHYHRPHNLVIAMLLEAAELLQIVQWMPSDEADSLLRQASSNPQMQSEIADLTINLLSLCTICSVDLKGITVTKARQLIDRFQNAASVPKGSDRTAIRCPRCEQVVKAFWKYCPSCGTEIAS